MKWGDLHRGKAGCIGTDGDEEKENDVGEKQGKHHV